MSSNSYFADDNLLLLMMMKLLKSEGKNLWLFKRKKNVECVIFLSGWVASFRRGCNEGNQLQLSFILSDVVWGCLGRTVKCLWFEYFFPFLAACAENIVAGILYVLV